MTTHAVRIRVAPSPALIVERISIRVEGLRPGALVRLATRLTDTVGVVWEAVGEYAADHRGVVDVARAPSRAGTYVGRDASGLFWSMHPQVDIAPAAFKSTPRHPRHAYGRPGFEDEPETTVAVLCFEGDTELARTEFTLRFRTPEVEIEPLRAGRLRGLVWGPRDGSPGRGVVFVFTGSDGGADKSYAPVLASLGYRVVSLAYFNYEDRPPFLVDVDLEYFEEAFAWARATFGVERVAIKGGSRGGELVLLLGATYPHALCGIVADIPMHCVLGAVKPDGSDAAAWTLGGRPVPYVRAATGEAAPLPGGPEDVLSWRAVSDPMIKNSSVTAAAEIAVERIACPLLLVSGEDDQLWDSAWGADRVVDRLRAHGATIDYEHLCLRETGHWLGVPNRVTSLLGPIKHPLIPRYFALGGTPAGTAREAWRHWATLTRFLERCFEGPR